MILIPGALAVGLPFLLAAGIADILGAPVVEKRRTSNTALSAVSIASISRGDLAVSIEHLTFWI